MSKVKIEDVAEKAGTSVTTVSRVLNNRGYISQSMRERVLKAVKELNYQPNELARSLFKGNSNMLGLIIPTVLHPFFSELAYHIENYAYAKGYKLLLCNSNLDLKKESQYIDLLKRNQVDGIMVCSHVLKMTEYLNLNLPIVSFDRIIAESVPLVTSDNLTGGKLAAQLLMKKECKSLVMIYGGMDVKPHKDLVPLQRFQGFIQTIENTDINCITFDSGKDINFDLLLRFFQEHPEIDGVFAGSDNIAATIIQVCHQLKKAIPDDIKIVGFDDISLASLVMPRLTTIRQPIQKMGELIVDLIIKQVNGEEVPHFNCLPVTLIERETT